MIDLNVEEIDSSTVKSNSLRYIVALVTPSIPKNLAVIDQQDNKQIDCPHKFFKVYD